MVLAARDKQGAGAGEALAALCSTYWYPIYAFIRRQGSSPHDAEDLLARHVRAQVRVKTEAVDHTVQA